ncbi:hypothetical protein LEP1GSC150_3580 [Leptospira interrogans serovar Copenhageni str. LT2050]|uniref:Uncharacterized protein n=1 Tax=Leptospira interrogans serovar Copenhageni str. LT2050 TaxID=1001598 RepID=M3HYS6_LEPIT|nr:hypothetical protein LEP1GSC150_3580 [Leptospira interrogans serovar Copenhageni str. LT2050]
MSDSLKNFTDSLLKDLEENENGFLKSKTKTVLPIFPFFPQEKRKAGRCQRNFKKN